MVIRLTRRMLAQVRLIENVRCSSDANLALTTGVDRSTMPVLENRRNGGKDFMPLYEYQCSDCETCFDALRAMSEADAPIACPNCGGEETRRMISLFSAVGDGRVIAGAGASCGSCSPSASCATCGQKP
jgi:putative FmdB family regulatory protein